MQHCLCSHSEFIKSMRWTDAACGMQVKRVEERLADRTMHLVLQASSSLPLQCE